MGRAEAYAYTHGPVASLFDGIGMGLGFTVALTCIGMVRELLGSGKLFGFSVMPGSFTPILIFVLAPGAFFVLAMLTAIQNFVKIQGEKRGKDMSKIGSGCSHDCLHCMDGSCADNQNEAFLKSEEEKEEKDETEEKPKAVKSREAVKKQSRREEEQQEAEESMEFIDLDEEDE